MALRSPVTISLIVPIYRVEKYIGEFAESVLGQPYPHIEFIFVNDDTDDSSIDVLEGLIDTKYSHLKDRIRIVKQSHSGLPAARRTGLSYATGDYVWHVDPDDWVEKDAVARIAEVAERTAADLIYFNFMQEYSCGSKLKCEKRYDISCKDEYVFNMFNQKAYACVWNKCIKRSVYDSHDVFFPKHSYAEDTYLMTQLVSYCSSMSYLDMALYHYRKDNNASLSHQKRKQRRLEFSLNFIDLYERLKDRACDDGPLALLKDSIMLRAGWYSMVYGLDLFTSFPFLKSMIRQAKLVPGMKIGILPQIITKLACCCFKR